MTVFDFALLVAAGFGAGVVGFVTGLASIVSYPALLAVGLSPVSANVTNTVALVAVGAGSVTNSYAELAKGGRSLIAQSAFAALGGTVGAVVLLVAPEGSFEAIVPVLVVLAAVAMLMQPRLRALAAQRKFPKLYPFGIFVTSIYGGYFGAGAGVIIMALIMICTSESIWRASILKSYLLGLANLVAAVLFAVLGPVHWLAALAMALGCFAGGWLGPPIVKVIPPNLLRIAVALCAFGLAIWLWVS